MRCLSYKFPLEMSKRETSSGRLSTSAERLNRHRSHRQLVSTSPPSCPWRWIESLLVGTSRRLQRSRPLKTTWHYTKLMHRSSMTPECQRQGQKCKASSTKMLQILNAGSRRSLNSACGSKKRHMSKGIKCRPTTLLISWWLRNRQSTSSTLWNYEIRKTVSNVWLPLQTKSIQNCKWHWSTPKTSNYSVKQAAQKSRC